jgi:sensor histidine kinase YesM
MEPNRIGPPGIGLANTVERLTALYGAAFDLDIRSMPGATVALISFPAIPLNATLRSAS